jgi:hypothetical protein
MNPVAIGLWLLAVAAILALTGRLAKARLAQLREWNKAQAAFSKNSAALIKDERVPELVVSLLGFLSGKALTFKGFVIFTCAAIVVRFSHPSRPEGNPLSRAIHEMSPAQRQQLLRAMDAYFAAIGFQSFLLGWLFRWVTKPLSKVGAEGDGCDTQELLLVDMAYRKQRLATAA